MDENKRRVKLEIRGIVQGVFFRAETRSKARDLGLNGYVRNMPNGSVEAMAEGPSVKVDAFINWCGSGPPLARVENVLVTEQEPEGTESGFIIKY